MTASSLTVNALENNNHGNGIIDDVGGWDSNFGSDFAFDISNPDFDGEFANSLGGTDCELNSLDHPCAVESASGSDLQLSSIEETIIQLARGKVTGARGHTAATASQKIYITHEDFEEGPERDAFLLIYGYAENLFSETKSSDFNLNDLTKIRAIDFFFCRTIGGLHLDDAVNCIDNTIRIDVIRLRFMLEFWIRGWVLPAMPKTADPLPARIEVTAATRSGLIGIALAREAWFHPGIDAADLLKLAYDETSSSHVTDKVKIAFNELVCDYVLSINNGRVYCTGKNPILELEDRVLDPTLSNRNQLANLHWSRKF